MNTVSAPSLRYMVLWIVLIIVASKSHVAEGSSIVVAQAEKTQVILPASLTKHTVMNWLSSAIFEIVDLPDLNSVSAWHGHFDSSHLGLVPSKVFRVS